MLRGFWKKWVYDPAQLPIQWQTHPHRAFKVISRLGAAFLGSIMPVCLLLIQVLRSDALQELDKATNYAFVMLVAVTLAFIASWAMALIYATASEEKSLLKHMLLGALPPSGMSLVYLTVQGPK